MKSFPYRQFSKNSTLTEGNNNNRRPGGNYNNDRHGGSMVRKRPWEGGNDDSQAKRLAPAARVGGNSRFSSNVPSVVGGNGFKSNSYNAGGPPKNFSGSMGGGYNRGVSAQGYQPRTFNKPYEQKPPMTHSMTSAPPAVSSNSMPMAYQPSYNTYQPMQFAQYPMAYAFPPPSSTSLMPPLPKN